MDSDDGIAVDRYLFFATTQRNVTAMDDGIVMATGYLNKHADMTVLMDRAMAYRKLGLPGLALEDFARVGRTERDARAMVFAAYSAFALGNRPRAARYLHEALRFWPGFRPALHALGRLHKKC